MVLDPGLLGDYGPGEVTPTGCPRSLRSVCVYISSPGLTYLRLEKGGEMVDTSKPIR